MYSLWDHVAGGELGPSPVILALLAAIGNWSASVWPRARITAAADPQCCAAGTPGTRCALSGRQDAGATHMPRRLKPYSDDLRHARAAVCQSLRIASFTVTQLPAPNYHCRLPEPTAVKAMPEHWWQHLYIQNLKRQVGPCRHQLSVLPACPQKLPHASCSPL